MLTNNPSATNRRATALFRQLFAPACTTTMARPIRTHIPSQVRTTTCKLLTNPIRQHCNTPINALLEKGQPVKRLARELARPGYHPAPITLGLNKDPYEVNSRQLAQTRSILQLLLAHQHPVHIITKSHLVVKDLDILTQLAAKQLCSVEICLHTLDSQLSRKIEPRTSSPSARLKAITRLSAAKVPVGAAMSPLIPVVNDAEMEQLLGAAKNAGALAAGYEYLNLPTDVSDQFDQWLQRHFPQQADRIFKLSQANFSSSAIEFARMVQQRFQLCCQKLGLSRNGLPPLNTSCFQAHISQP